MSTQISPHISIEDGEYLVSYQQCYSVACDVKDGKVVKKDGTEIPMNEIQFFKRIF